MSKSIDANVELNLFPIGLVKELRITQYPLQAYLVFETRRIENHITFTAPQPLENLIRFFDGEIYEIKLIDLNVANQGWIEGGRYQVDLIDEDGYVVSFNIDSYEHIASQVVDS